MVLLFSSVWKSDETQSTSFEITSPTKKISLKYHLNMFSQFNYILHLRPEMCMILKKMCMMCMILSPNCCAVISFEYSSTDARCHVAVCQF